jgi:CMP/dCMP kinase
VNSSAHSLAPGLVVAVDGTSGSGKSSTSRGVADRLGLRYLDTGAMFRAMTWWLLGAGVDVHDPAAVAARCGEPEILSGTDPLAPTITVDGVDVSVGIRSDEVNAAVSPVSAVPEVRARLLELQRAVIAEESAHGGIVVEGRDIGTVVWPDADVKVFLTASEGERARRRSGDASGGGETAETLARRDAIDSGRAASPTRAAADALIIDSTTRPVDQVVDQLLQLIEAARASRPR